VKNVISGTGYGNDDDVVDVDVFADGPNSKGGGEKNLPSLFKTFVLLA
jgi:hypothetical protein